MRDIQQDDCFELDCGHEIYTGEHYVWVPHKGVDLRFCPDCFRDWVGKMDDGELADMMGLIAEDYDGNRL